MRDKKYFSAYREPMAELPYLAKVQLDSYNWFVTKGLRELLDEFGPIVDVTGKEYALSFKEFTIDEPAVDEYEARANNASYESPLRVMVELENKQTGEIKSQEIYFIYAQGRR